MTQTLLAIENLSVGFRHQQTVRTVVNDVSLQIAAGETLALVGESGSGKSVTALSILRLLPCPPVEYLSGDIRFHGESLLHASDQTLRGVRGNKIAMIFQEPMVSLNPLHTLEKQLYEVLSLHRGMRREAARGEILNCLDRVGMRGHCNVRLVLLVGLVALMGQLAVDANALTQALCHHGVGVHINELVLQRRTARIDDQYFHSSKLPFNILDFLRDSADGIAGRRKKEYNNNIHIHIVHEIPGLHN